LIKVIRQTRNLDPSSNMKSAFDQHMNINSGSLSRPPETVSSICGFKVHNVKSFDRA
jgi:hypothetical protein